MMNFKPHYVLPHFRTLQESAYADVLDQGLPTVNDEDWKYSDLNSVFQQRDPAVVTAHKNKLTIPEHFPARYAMRWVFVDGVFCKERSHLTSIEGLTIDGFSTIDPHALSPKMLNTIAKPQAASLLKLNTAMFQEGLFVHLKKNVRVDLPIQVVHLFSDSVDHLSGSSHYFRSFVHLEAHSRLTMVHYFSGVSQHATLMCPVTEVKLDANAVLHHYHVQHETILSSHLAGTYVEQDVASQFHHHAMHTGAAFSRHDIEVYLKGEHAECYLKGLYSVRGRQHHDTHTLIEHAVPNTKSDEEYRGVLGDYARAVFNGKVIVRENAIRTDANQQNKNLLLSNDAEIDTKPELQIYSDDVKCSHGATVGQLDAEALYYLRSRGIEEAQAKEMLIAAFSKAMLDKIEDDMLKDFLVGSMRQS